MSKYNLTDILEHYKIGSGFTTDFDYEGMLKSGLKTGVDTDIKILRKMSDDFEDVNYHRENNHLQMAIDALEEGAIKEASMFFGDFHAEIESTMETLQMDIEPTLGKFMDAKMDQMEAEEKKLPMDENEEAVDLAIEASQEKAGIKEDKYDDIVNADDDIPADKKKAAALAYRKVDKGDSYENATSHVDESFNSLAKKLDKQKGITKDEAGKIAGKIANIKRKGGGKGPTAKQKKRMNEVRIDRDVAERIEGMLNIPMKKKFMESFMDLYSDLLESDEFFPEDIINHLNNEMHKELVGYQVAGDRLAGLEENSDTFNIDKVASPDAKAHDYGDEIKGISDEDDTEEKYAQQMVLPLEEEDYTDRKGKALYPILKAGANATGDEVEMYVQSLAKDIDLNGKEGYSKFTADDFIEDFKEYIADKQLQEHFKRFM